MQVLPSSLHFAVSMIGRLRASGQYAAYEGRRSDPAESVKFRLG